MTWILIVDGDRGRAGDGEGAQSAWLPAPTRRGLCKPFTARKPFAVSGAAVSHGQTA